MLGFRDILGRLKKMNKFGFIFNLLTARYFFSFIILYWRNLSEESSLKDYVMLAYFHKFRWGIYEVSAKWVFTNKCCVLLLMESRFTLQTMSSKAKCRIGLGNFRLKIIKHYIIDRVRQKVCCYRPRIEILSSRYKRNKTEIFFRSYPQDSKQSVISNMNCLTFLYVDPEALGGKKSSTKSFLTANSVWAIWLFRYLLYLAS